MKYNVLLFTLFLGLVSTPLDAMHHVRRAIIASYFGCLYQIKKAIDEKIKHIPFQPNENTIQSSGLTFDEAHPQVTEFVRATLVNQGASKQIIEQITVRKVPKNDEKEKKIYLSKGEAWAAFSMPQLENLTTWFKEVKYSKKEIVLPEATILELLSSQKTYYFDKNSSISFDTDSMLKIYQAICAHEYHHIVLHHALREKLYFKDGNLAYIGALATCVPFRYRWITMPLAILVTTLLYRPYCKYHELEADIGAIATCDTQTLQAYEKSFRFLHEFYSDDLPQNETLKQAYESSVIAREILQLFLRPQSTHPSHLTRAELIAAAIKARTENN